MVQGQPRQIVCETLSPKTPRQKRAGEVAQGVGPEFEHQYHKKRKKKSKERAGRGPKRGCLRFWDF
jgi:hypothetical protein